MSKYKKNKKKQIISQDLQEPVLLPGKFQCQCHATIHKLINNCVNCGRIVCEQEGEGDCQTCGQRVVARANMSAATQNITNTEEAFPEFKADYDMDKEKAVQQKNKLIERDRSNFMKNNVFDEQTDWYQVQDNVWQAKETRELAVQKLIERENKLHEIQQSHTVVYDTKTGKWVNREQNFDEKKFRQQAQEFVNTMSSKEMIEKSSAMNKQNLQDQEVELYDSIRSELNAKYKQNTSNNSKQQQQKQNNIHKNIGKIVQVEDDFYTQFQ